MLTKYDIISINILKAYRVITSTSNKKYLIYLDILGFDKLTKDLEVSTGLKSSKIRLDFVEVIKKQIESIEGKKYIVGKKYGESDDWILVCNSLEDVFRSVLILLSHDTGYRGCQNVPLEIAIGTAEYDVHSQLEGLNLIVQDATIRFYKTNIINRYHSYFKKRHNGETIRSTFIICTNTVYDSLELADKKYCKRIVPEIGSESVKFYLAKPEWVIRRGKILEFLALIGQPGSRMYRRIDSLYVPPVEINDIQKSLVTKRICFITGTQEIGKTYTAIRLMWEYYNRGYEPKWVKGEERSQRIEIRERLENIKNELQPGSIIYFEDPFGKTQYEARQSLEREIGLIIESVSQIKNVYVLITSREEVFKEFNKEKISKIDLEEFERKLNIHKPSYNCESRKSMLIQWAECENCVWLHINQLKQDLILAMEDQTVLPTPLSIRDFAIATANVNDFFQLETILKEKSEETETAFSKEIENMSSEKILFLAFPYISEYFDPKSIKKQYKKGLGSLDIKDPLDFEQVFDWFIKDKINFNGSWVQFSHPSYSVAFKRLLTKKGRVSQIFIELLQQLIENKFELRAITRAINDNFDYISIEKLEPMLITLSRENSVDAEVGEIIYDHIYQIPRSIRYKLIEILSMSDRVAPVIVEIIGKVNYLAEKARINPIIKSFAVRGLAADSLAEFLYERFDILDNEVKEDLVSKLSLFESSADTIAKLINEYFTEIEKNTINNVLLNLSYFEVAYKSLALTINTHFKEIPKELIYQILGQLAEDDKCALVVSNIVSANFDDIAIEVRNQLVLSLSRKASAAKYVTEVLGDHFDDLPEGIRNQLIVRLINNMAVRSSLRDIILYNNDSLPAYITDIISRIGLS